MSIKFNGERTRATNLIKKKEKNLSALEMNGKPAPLYLSCSKTWSETCVAHRQPLLLYQSFFSSSSSFPRGLLVPTAALLLSLSLL